MYVTVAAAAPIIFLVTFAAKGAGFQEMEAYSLLVNLRKGMQSSSEQPLVGEERYVTTLITAAKETNLLLTTEKVVIHSPTVRDLETFSRVKFF